MSSPDRDALWQKYLSTKRMGGTPEQCQWAWDRYWKLEMADSIATCAADAKAEKREQSKAAHA